MLRAHELDRLVRADNTDVVALRLQLLHDVLPRAAAGVLPVLRLVPAAVVPAAAVDVVEYGRDLLDPTDYVVQGLAVDDLDLKRLLHSHVIEGQGAQHEVGDAD